MAQCAAESGTTLDNPAWWALTGIDRHLSEGGGKARRYKPAVSPLAAVSDEHDPQTWAEMAELAAGSPVTAVTSGLAASIVGSLVNDIRAGGRRPFLNVAVENVHARRLYQKLGFKDRMQVTVRVLQAPSRCGIP